MWAVRIHRINYKIRNINNNKLINSIVIKSNIFYSATHELRPEIKNLISGYTNCVRHYIIHYMNCVRFYLNDWMNDKRTVKPIIILVRFRSCCWCKR